MLQPSGTSRRKERKIPLGHAVPCGLVLNDGGQEAIIVVSQIEIPGGDQKQQSEQ